MRNALSQSQSLLTALIIDIDVVCLLPLGKVSGSVASP